MSNEIALALVTAGGIAGYLHLKRRVEALERRLGKAAASPAPSAESEPFAVSMAPPATAVAKVSAAPQPKQVSEVRRRPDDWYSLEGLVNKAAAVTTATADILAVAPAPAAAAPKPALSRNTPVAAEPSLLSQATDTLVGLVKKNPFASLGVLLMLIGVGFLFSLLAASNILPPTVRVALVALVGVGVFGVSLKQESRRYGLALNLQGGALALEFLCALWAYQGYELVSALTAFVWMGGLSTLSIGWAMYKRRGLFAFMGLAGALLTPIFASTGHGDFAGLTGYCLWVGILGLGAGVHLRMPSLASTSLAGISALLGAAMHIPAGNTTLAAACLVGMTVLYCGVALTWTRAQTAWSPRAQASIVAILIGAPLIAAGFLYGPANVSAKACAVLIGAASLAYLATMVKAPAEWKQGLFSIGAGLGLVALGVGLDGAGRALALSAAAMGMVLAARALKKPWADAGAMVYWLVSLAFGADELQAGHALSAMPLGISGAVALAAGFFYRGAVLGCAYTLVAPWVLAAASLWAVSNPKIGLLVWFLVWTPAAFSTGKLMRWPDLLLSAVWVVYAGLVPFLAHIPDVHAQLWVREATLLGWLGASAWIVRRLHLDAEVPLTLTSTAAANFSLLFPVLMSVELDRVLTSLHLSGPVEDASMGLLWAGWYIAAHILRARRGFDARVCVVGRVALVVGALNLLFDASLFGTMVQWLALAGTALALRAFPSKRPCQAWPVLGGCAGAVLVGNILQALGHAYGVDACVAELLVTRVMQPWVSVLWAAASISVVAFASQKRLRRMWMGGGLSVLVLIGKMLLVDLDTLTLVAKVVVFLVTGLGFVALGYFCPLPPEKDAAAP